MQYIPADDGTPSPSRVHIATGYALIFKFIRGDGIGSQFGKLDNVFKLKCACINYSVTR